MSKPKKGQALTEKRKVFVEAYLRSWNASEAARVAGYSKKSSGQIGYDLLKIPQIKAEIERRLGEMAMSANEVIARLTQQARASQLPFVRIDDDGFVYFNFADPEARANFHLIKKIKTKRERRIDGRGDDAQEWEGEWVEVELHDPQRALELLGKHYQIFTDHMDVTSGGEKLPAMSFEQIAQRVTVLMELAKQRKEQDER